MERILKKTNFYRKFWYPSFNSKFTFVEKYNIKVIVLNMLIQLINLNRFWIIYTQKIDIFLHQCSAKIIVIIRF